MGDLIGRTLGHYLFIETVGAGGMGVVYRARDTRLDRDVAVKVLPTEVARDTERLARFEREAKAVAALSHPNILEIHDFDTDDGTTYAVTELLEGETLQEYLDHFDGRLPWERALEIVDAVSSGLAAAHGKGVIHRDIKPSNIFLCQDGRAKILDFGLAATHDVIDTEGETGSIEAPLTERGAVMGTVGYMSPEQVRGEPADHRSDIFSLGCVLYEMLSGRRAFKSDTGAETMTAILREDPPPLAKIAAEVPAEIDRIVARALAKNRADRHGSVDELRRELVEFRTKWEEAGRTITAGQLLRFVRRPVVAGTLTVLLIAAVVFGVREAKQRARLSWARSTAFPEITRLAEEGKMWDAFMLAREVELVLGDDPALTPIWPVVSAELPAQLLPEGVELHGSRLDLDEPVWVHLVKSEDGLLKVPNGRNRYRVTFPNHVGEPFTAKPALLPALLPGATMPPIDGSPEGMARILAPPYPLPVFLKLYDFESPERVARQPFFIDRYEVTNREYAAFVEAGGYRDPVFWNHEFVAEGETLTFEQAMELFVDTTGRPGPATWEFGRFPDGTADYPVTGVSWYEAAAFAEFAGKRLPNVYQWELAGAIFDGVNLLPGSNFDSDGLAPVGNYALGLNPTGLYDAAGNAQEWCWNATGNLRFVLGGAWNGPKYFFFEPNLRPPMERDTATGFRCALPLDPNADTTEPDRALVRKERPDWDGMTPFSDEVWETWLGFFSYPDLPLEPEVERVGENTPHWRMEKITFAAAYNDERMLGFLFLPTIGEPPFQTVVYWPGLAAGSEGTSHEGTSLQQRIWDFLVKDGRAVFCPIIKGTYGRGGSPMAQPFEFHYEFLSNREIIVKQVQDISRSIDYLETRDDIDGDRIAYMGLSWGACMGPLSCAVEERFATGVLMSGCLHSEDAFSWAHRATAPMLMLNGRYDTSFPFEEAQVPLFEALGTPAEHKRHLVFETGHELEPARVEWVRATLEWLDDYLGPVN
jgi:formylglycine-generating enzyme required for sulfatase activity/cephalosporin-C deacetylase-like acetyl esterase